MTSWCPSEPVSLNGCESPRDTAEECAADERAFLYAQAIHNAAIELIDMSCHTDRGLDFGRPRLDDTRCCGAVSTGIVPPAELAPSNGCYSVVDLEWEVLVSWDESKSSVRDAAREASRLGRLLGKQACCELAGATSGWSPVRLGVIRTSSEGFEAKPHLRLTCAVLKGDR